MLKFSPKRITDSCLNEDPVSLILPCIIQTPLNASCGSEMITPTGTIGQSRLLEEHQFSRWIRHI